MSLTLTKKVSVGLFVCSASITGICAYAWGRFLLSHD